MGWGMFYLLSISASILTTINPGPLPWVYVADIFPTRTRHFGLAVASSSQWLFSMYWSYNSIDAPLTAIPTTQISWFLKLRLIWWPSSDGSCLSPSPPSISSVWVHSLCKCILVAFRRTLLIIGLLASRRLIPETKGRSLEEMDIIFGTVSAEERQKHIDKQQRGKRFLAFASRPVEY